MQSPSVIIILCKLQNNCINILETLKKLKSKQRSILSDQMHDRVKMKLELYKRCS